MRVTRPLKALGRLLEVLLLLAVILAGGLALRLAAGPISLEPFAPYIARFVERAGPFAITFTDPALAWSQEQQSVLLQVRDLEVRTAAGEFVAAAPTVGLRIDLPTLLRQQQIRLREVQVSLPALQLIRQADDRLVLNFGGQMGALPLTEATGGGVLDRLAGGAPGTGDERLAMLRRIRVAAESLQYFDEESGRLMESGAARLRLTREDDGWEMRLDVAAIGGVSGSRLRLTAAPTAGSPMQEVELELQSFPAASLSELFPEVPLAGSRLPVSAMITASFDPGTRTPGPGSFRVTAPEGTLASPPYLAQPVEIRGLALAGTGDAGWRTISLDSGEVRFPDAVLHLAGAAERGRAAQRLRLDLRGEGVDHHLVLRLWPLPLARSARGWLEEHVDAGQIPNARLAMTLPAGEPEPRPDIALDFTITEGAVRILPDWPAAEGLNGTGRLAEGQLVLDLAAGRIGGVTAEKGTLTFTELRTPKPTRLAVALDARGSVQEALDLLGREPIDLDARLGIAPEATSGTVQAQIALGLPLERGITPTDVTKQVTASLADLGVREIRPGYDVSGAALEVALDDAAATITGEVRVNDVPARITWRERLQPGGERRRVEVGGTLDPERARALGAAFPDGVRGTATVDAVVSEADGQPRRYDVEADLAQLRVDLPRLGLTKLPGAPGRLTATITEPAEKRLEIAEAHVEWPGVNMRGSGAVRLAPFLWERIELRDTRTAITDLSGTLTREGELIRAVIRAQGLDLRPFTSGEGGGGAGFDQPVDLDLTARHLFLGPEPLEAVTVQAVRRLEGLTRFAAEARLPGGGTVSAHLDAAQPPGSFRAETSDLGALFRGLDIQQSRLEGGRGRVEGRIETREGVQVWTGEAKLRDLIVRDAPFLARLLTLASLQGLSNTLAGRGLEVSRVTIPFVWSPGRVELRQARMVGSGLGARVDGAVDLAGRTLALDGTIAPLYTLNRLIGQIPILGNLLRGERADAAIAATFSVTGGFDNPQVIVNPLAALVPGLLRDLLGDLFDGLTPAEQSPPGSRN